MVHETSPHALASTVLELQRHGSDPQLVLTSLVQLHALLTSHASSSALLSLSAGHSSLSDAVQTLQLVLQEYLHTEEEIVWFVCRVVTVWSRAVHRFQLEAGHIRLWKILHVARATYPESPRVMEASLEATVSLFHGVELHQLFASSKRASEIELVDEMLQLMDRFDNPPARHTSLSPHYNFSRLVVFAMDVLCKLLASPQVVSTSFHSHDLQTRSILERQLKMLPHFLKTSDASRTWLEMSRLQLQYAPQTALQILFVEAPAATSWCQQLIHAWRNDPLVVYDFTTLFTQAFAVPHGSETLSATTPSDEIAHAVIHRHGVLTVLIPLLRESSARLRASSSSKSEVDRHQPIVLEIVRAIRMFSCVPEMLTAVSDTNALVLVIVSEVEFATSGLRTASEATNQSHLRILLELVLTFQQLAQLPAFGRAIASAETLPPLLAQAVKRVSSVQISCPHDAKDSELPAVLLRELQKTTKHISALPASFSSSSSRDKLLSTNRGLPHRVTSSSTRTASFRTPTITRTTSPASSTTLSPHSMRHSPSPSSSLVRTASHRRL